MIINNLHDPLDNVIDTCISYKGALFGMLAPEERDKNRKEYIKAAKEYKKAMKQAIKMLREDVKELEIEIEQYGR